MRLLLALVLSAALLAGCASDDPESVAADDTEVDSDDGTEEQPTEDDASADEDAAQDPEDGQPDADDGTDEDAAETEGASSGAVEVEIGDFFFEDDQLSIEVGDTVTWAHQGDITHNVTSRDESFVSDNLSSGDTFTHTFDTAGAFEYVCTLHGQMTATIEVT